MIFDLKFYYIFHLKMKFKIKCCKKAQRSHRPWCNAFILVPFPGPLRLRFGTVRRRDIWLLARPWRNFRTPSGMEMMNFKLILRITFFKTLSDRRYWISWTETILNMPRHTTRYILLNLFILSQPGSFLILMSLSCHKIKCKCWHLYNDKLVW